MTVKKALKVLARFEYNSYGYVSRCPTQKEYETALEVIKASIDKKN